MINKRSYRNTFLLASMVGVLSFVRHWFDALANHDDISVGSVLVNELSAAWLAALLLLPVIALSRRYPPWRWPWWPWYVMGAVVFAACHTLAMLISRSVLYPLLGFGAYHYGELNYRFVMEAPVQIIVFASVIIILYLLRQMEQAREAERLRTLLAQSQLQSLRLQLAPHFLFNALNTISAVAYETPAKADELIGRLSRLLRVMLTGDRHTLVPLGEELTAAREYVAIQQARFEHQLVFDMAVPAAHTRYRVPTMILQPLIENAFKYGVSQAADQASTAIAAGSSVAGHVSGQLRVAIHSEVTATHLLLSVRDYGAGLSQSKPFVDIHSDGATEAVVANSHGLGLANIRERLQLIYGDAARLDLSNVQGGGAEACLHIPLRGEE